jgi:hypothetical protein
VASLASVGAKFVNLLLQLRDASELGFQDLLNLSHLLVQLVQDGAGRAHGGGVGPPGVSARPTPAGQAAQAPWASGARWTGRAGRSG